MSVLSSLLPPIQHEGLEVGDPLPEFDWLNQRDEPVSLYTDSNCGRVTVLLVCRSAGSAVRQIAGFRDRFGDFDALAAQVFVVTTDSVTVNRLTAENMNLPFPVLSDPSLSAGLGLGMGDAELPWGTAILSPNTRILRLISPAATEAPAAAALEYLNGLLAPAPPGVVVSQPPILTVPNVLGPELCAKLISDFENGEQYTGGLTNVQDGDYVIVPDTKVRTDVGVPDTDGEGQRIYANFRKRVFPEIFKAFRYRVTRAESMRIGRYAADEGGKFAPHRDDNVPAMRHRRFGFTINLNLGGYEGGYLRFPEYGPQLFAPETGGMVVFSVSLLHEATPVTAGVRYGLFGFFFGETEEAWRKKQNPSFDSAVVDSPGGTFHVGRGTA